MNDKNQEMYELTDEEAAKTVGGLWTYNKSAKCKYPPGTRIRGVIGYGFGFGEIEAVEMENAPRMYKVRIDFKCIIAREENILA